MVAALERGVRVFYIQGDTPLFVDEARALVEGWGVARCGLPAFNHARARGGDERARDAVHSARTVPMMADLRVVTLLDLERAGDDVLEALVEYLEDPSPSTLLVAVAGAWGKPKKGEKAWGARLTNAFKKVGHIEKCDAAGVDRVRFAIARAAASGAKLGRSEAALLVELVGTDLGRLAGEVDKLSVFVGAEAIRPDHLREVCSALAEEDVWELTSGLARRDPALALRALHRLLADAKEPHYLLAMVVMQLRKVLQAVQLARRGAPDAEIARVVRLRSPEVEQVRRLAALAPDPAPVLERLLRANREMNSHRAGPERALESVVLELCGR
jgi:DNA polymerase III subunit delta